MAGKEMKGTVKWFSAKRGYGFLVDADGIDYLYITVRSSQKVSRP